MNRQAATARAHRFFVAGTDTGVGKTRVTVGLLAAARNLGLRVAGMKPVAAGTFVHEGRNVNHDAVKIADVCAGLAPYEDVNPYCLEEPISPHIAAAMAGIAIDSRLIVKAARRLGTGRDLLLIEGAGGWYCPISADRTMADVAEALRAPVILVVGLKLGCLNHARLTREAIERSRCAFAGWIGTQVDRRFGAANANLATLESLLAGPALGLLPYAPDPALDAGHLRAAVQRLLRSA